MAPGCRFRYISSGGVGEIAAKIHSAAASCFGGDSLAPVIRRFETRRYEPIKLIEQSCEGDYK